jgi:hypothetical protein
MRLGDTPSPVNTPSAEDKKRSETHHDDKYHHDNTNDDNPDLDDIDNHNSIVATQTLIYFDIKVDMEEKALITLHVHLISN